MAIFGKSADWEEAYGPIHKQLGIHKQIANQDLQAFGGETDTLLPEIQLHDINNINNVVKTSSKDDSV